VDGKVAWEGDPGFSSQNKPAPPFGSFVDTPMEDLASRRRLTEVKEWRRAWQGGGETAIANGDVSSALALMQEAREFGASPFADVRRAAARLTALEAAIDDPDETLRVIKESDAAPAVDALIGWAADLGTPFGKKKQAAMRKKARGKSSSHWKRAVKEAAKATKGKKDDAARAEELLAKLAELQGTLVRALEDDVRSLGIAGAESADRIPAAWLARNVFGW
ncbi:MAG: hypothetical protein AAGB93_24090, partial [Planctomycetota bacterium]